MGASLDIEIVSLKNISVVDVLDLKLKSILVKLKNYKIKVVLESF